MDHEYIPGQTDGRRRPPRRIALLAATALLAVGTALGAGAVAASTASEHGTVVPPTFGDTTGLNIEEHSRGPGEGIDCFEVNVEDCPEVAN